MDRKMDFNSFAPKLGRWAESFKPFIESREMWDIMQKIKEDAKREVVVPHSSNTFRAFLTTNPATVRVIFYMMDPYPGKYPDGKLQATGIAMDCSNSPDGKIQPSLMKWYDAVSRNLGKEIEYSPSLEYLHEQGVMLLNTDLTCKLNKTQSHEGLWEPFQRYFLEEIMGNKVYIIYVLCGRSSHRLEKYINPYCRIFKLSHPVSAAYSNTEWEDGSIFNRINNILGSEGSPPIYWNRREWEEFKSSVPF